MAQGVPLYLALLFSFLAGMPAGALLALSLFKRSLSMRDGAVAFVASAIKALPTTVRVVVAHDYSAHEPCVVCLRKPDRICGEPPSPRGGASGEGGYESHS